MNKKIFITGGAGFIGGFLTEELLKMGQTVAIYDKYLNFINNAPYYRQCLKIRKKHLKKEPNKVYKGDIRNMAQLRSAVEDFRPDVVVHLAGLPMARAPKNYEHLMIPINMQGTINTLDVFENSTAKRLVFASSSMSYGHFSMLPQPEEAILNPINLYGATKAAGEYFTKLSNKKWVIVRATSVYGFTDCANRVTQILFDAAFRKKPAWVVEGEILDFSYIDDVVEGYIKCIFTKEAAGEIFNISRGEGRYAVEFANIVRKFFPDFTFEIKKPMGDQVWRGAMDIQKAKKILKFNPKYSIEEGVEKTVQLIKKYDFYNF